VPVNASIDTLARQFLVRTQGDIGRLNELIDRAANGDWFLLKDSARICHSIQGAGAMFGYPKLVNAAEALQRQLEDLLRNFTIAPSRECADMILLADSADQLAGALVEAAGARPAQWAMFS
jgi:HPt (histidine-containing phosphotransfer) domain-containing protein